MTTLLFALAHFEFTRTPLLFVVALPIALARMRTGRLAASVVAHQVNNLLPGVVLALALVGVLPTTWARSRPACLVDAPGGEPSGTMVDRPRGWPSTVPRPPRRRGPRGP